jgi:hypothetical protein
MTIERDGGGRGGRQIENVKESEIKGGKEQKGR